MKKETKTPPSPADFEGFEDWGDESPPVDHKEDPAPPPAPEVPKPKAPKAQKAAPNPVLEETVHMSADVPVHLVAVIGRTTVSVKDIMNYQMGQIVDLGRPPGETVDLVASGKLFARGELVDIDGKLGVRIIKLVK